ncbi:hypothetical protein H6G06_08210 [Anabaena sphaerica FACHB-251]|uniref:Spore coat protein U domain-containing protein n=1 Tax=Anabaena sphaerica FACHB-251 TaxID=2692883 RepID=A0A926WHB1_9NOST|nr:hypothetical protein [Anabaena sphaerica]MBD2293471.1 hypothetical protein [Anabaena sphaerica FACHB-251]
MIRRSLLTAALIIAGSAAIVPKAMAQSVDVPFTGSVGGVCNVGQVTPGLLGTNSPNNPTSLAAMLPGGSFGQFSVSCNQQALVSTSVPVQTGGPGFIPMFSGSFVNSPYGSSNANSGGTSSSHSIPPGGPTTFSVDMYVDKGGIPLTPGNYSYVTTVSITPF